MKCEKCGQTFDCGMMSDKNKCWCNAMPPLNPLPKEYKNCLCQNCLREFVKIEKTPTLIENEDFYFDGELVVFTDIYHLKRGFCCKSDCRHCPY